MPQTSHIAAALLALYAFVFLLAADSYDWDFPHLVASACLCVVLVALSVIDIASFRLPDRLNMLLFASGVAFTSLSGIETVPWHLGAAALGFGVLAGVGYFYRRFRGRPGLGLGDAKLFGAGGAWVGLDGLASTLMIACLSAFVGVAIAWIAGKRIEATTPLPFGPFLGFGIWAVWCFGPAI